MELIDRGELMKRCTCRKNCEECDFFTDGDSWCDGKLYGTTVMQMPTIDVVPSVHGHWVKDSTSGFWQCEECNMVLATMPTSYYKPAYKFCPYCGAKMDEVTEIEH